jgi:hypothetical protein
MQFTLTLMTAPKKALLPRINQMDTVESAAAVLASKFSTTTEERTVFQLRTSFIKRVVHGKK